SVEVWLAWPPGPRLTRAAPSRRRRGYAAVDRAVAGTSRSACAAVDRAAAPIGNRPAIRAERVTRLPPAATLVGCAGAAASLRYRTATAIEDASAAVRDLTALRVEPLARGGPAPFAFFAAVGRADADAHLAMVA